MGTPRVVKSLRYIAKYEETEE
jgi:hypothetical protein